jgi:hypothetical protein
LKTSRSSFGRASGAKPGSSSRGPASSTGPSAEARAGAEVVQFLRAVAYDEADDLAAGHRVLEDARVDHGGLDTAVGAGGGNDAEAVFPGDQVGEVRESGHHRSLTDDVAVAGSLTPLRWCAERPGRVRSGRVGKFMHKSGVEGSFSS